MEVQVFSLAVPALQPARTMKLPASAEMALAWGDDLVLTAPMPDVTHALDLRRWPIEGRALSGLFASSMARTSDGRVFAVARCMHANPYKLYEIDLATAKVTPRALGAPWHEPASVYAIGDRVLLSPGGTLRASGHRPGWWRDGALAPIGLTLPEPPQTVEHKGRRFAMPDRGDRVDAFSLPDGEALLIWFERLHRVSGEAATPLGLDHVFAAWESLREGRQPGWDGDGRAVSVVHDRLLAIDREGAWTIAAPGAARVTAAAQGPDGLWFVVSEEALHVVFSREREVAEVSLRAMRSDAKRALFMPKVAWVPSRDAVLVAHERDAWEFDLGALRREKRASFEEREKKLAAARRATWSRKVRSVEGAPIDLDALSQHTRGGGTLVEREPYGAGVVTYASETLRGGIHTITAEVLFEDRTRSFAYLGERWAERPRAFG